MKFSASRTALLLQCNAPFQENASEPPPQKKSEAAALGTKVHEDGGMNSEKASVQLV